MTRIDFYINADFKLLVTCRLAARAFKSRHKVLILTSDELSARALDKLLWTYQPISFVPHAQAGASIAPCSPVLVTDNLEEPPHHDVLINLTYDSPRTFSRFSRLIEIVGLEPDDREAARNRWKHYKNRGYPIFHHDFSKPNV